MTQDVDRLVKQELYWKLLKATEESLLKKNLYTQLIFLILLLNLLFKNICVFGSLWMPNIAPGPKNTAGIQLWANPQANHWISPECPWWSRIREQIRARSESCGKDEWPSGHLPVQLGSPLPYLAAVVNMVSYFKHSCLIFLICKMGLMLFTPQCCPEDWVNMRNF